MRARLARGHPIPVRDVAALARLGIGDHSLLGATRPVNAADAIGGAFGQKLTGRELGIWSLGPLSLAYVRSRVLALRPQLAIEFGSGTSTAILGSAMREVAVDRDAVLVVSFEQDEQHASDTRRLLEVVGLADQVVVVVAPLRAQQIEGFETMCYGMPDDVHRFFGSRLADLVLIDGPSAASAARFGTLPLVRKLVNAGAEFILDDAVRDDELIVAKRWRSLPYLRIDGIRMIERGLLTGVVLGERSP